MSMETESGTPGNRLNRLRVRLFRSRPLTEQRLAELGRLGRERR